MKQQIKTRESGIELLRIIAAMMVILSHLSGQILNSIEGLSSLGVRLLLAISVPAVDIFIIITGYFSWKNDRRTIGKPIGLVLMLVLFSLGSYFIQLVIGVSSFSLNSLLRYACPFNYFVTLWIALYLISPYINKCLRSLDQNTWKRFVFIIIMVFSVYPILIDIVQEVLGITLNGASSISRLGSQNGYNMVNFILCYCIGAFIGATKIDNNKSERNAVLVCIICIAILFVWSVIGKMMIPAYSNSAVSYHNPIVIILAASFFVLFKNIKFSNKHINRLAKAAFAAFLLHQHLFQILFIQYHITLSWYCVIAWMIVSAFLLYFISYFIWEIYNVCTNWFLKKLDSVEIHY